MLRKAISGFILFWVDFAWLFFSCLVATNFRFFLGDIGGLSDVVIPSSFLAPSIYYLSILLFFISKKIYIYHFDFWEETRRIYKSLFLSFLLVFSWLSLSQNTFEYSRSILLFEYLFLFLTMPIQKRILKYILAKTKLWYKEVNVDGEKSQKDILIEEMRKNWYLGMHHKEDAKTVIIASGDIPKEELMQRSQKYLVHQKAVFFVPTLSDVNFVDSEIFEMYNIRMSLISIENRLKNNFSQLIKSTFDFTVSILALPFLLFVFGLISAFIKYESPGPVIFRQKRLGRNGKVFECYKFRTMFYKGDKVLKAYLKGHPEELKHYKKYHKYIHDPRVTKIGNILRKTSLDELPQVINVFLGQMSLIGPRPYMVSERHKLDNKKTDILLVKPGITGLWQVSGRSDVDFESRKELDKWYIRNWSLWLDLIIFVKTIKVVLFGKGAK